MAGINAGSRRRWLLSVKTGGWEIYGQVKAPGIQWPTVEGPPWHEKEREVVRRPWHDSALEGRARPAQ
jgi:hypothetical protein